MTQTKNDCNFCGSTKSKVYLNLKDYRLNLPGKWDLFQCENCGLLYLFPQPNWDELKTHYPEQYHGYIKGGSRLTCWLRKMGINKRVKSILNHRKNKGILLDIGCATGDFLDRFRKVSGWQVSGLEIVEEAAEIARQKKLTIYSQNLLNINFPENMFDVITLWDVLEHMPDPSAVIKECHRILKKGGILVIKAPDPSGWEAKMFKETWVGFEAPQHLFGFPKNVLIDKLQKSGFEVVALKQTGSDYSSFFLSIAFWLKENQLEKVGLILTKFVRTFMGRIITGLMIRPLRLFGLKSSCIYY